MVSDELRSSATKAARKVAPITMPMMSRCASSLDVPSTGVILELGIVGFYLIPMETQIGDVALPEPSDSR